MLAPELTAAAVRIAEAQPRLPAGVLAEALVEQLLERGVDLKEDAFWELERAIGAAQPERPARQPGAKAEVPEPEPPPATAAPAPLDLRHLNRRPATLRREIFDPSAEVIPPRWTVKGVIPEQGLSLLIGATNQGKTFVALDLVRAILRGEPWFGRRVRRGSVAYISAEGQGGIRTRIKATLGLKPGAPDQGQLHLITEPPDCGPKDDASRLVATMAAVAADIQQAALSSPEGAPLRLLVLDTLHASMNGGEEDGAADMGVFLGLLRPVIEQHGLTALILHHPGKDESRGSRGSNSLPAAADSILTLRSSDRHSSAAELRTLKLTKCRDGAAGLEMTFTMPVVPMGIDEDGDEVTSRVLRPAEPVSLPVGKRSAGFTSVPEIVREHAGEDGWASLQAVRAAFLAAHPHLAGDAARKAWSRARKAAVDGGAELSPDELSIRAPVT